MRPFLILFLAIAIVSPAISQESSNFSKTLIVGGSLGFGAGENDQNLFIASRVVNGVFERVPIESKSANFSFSPYIGSEVSENWIIGGRGAISISNQEFSDFGFFDPNTGQFLMDDQKNTITTYGIGIFARYTFNPDKPFNVFLQPAVDYSQTKNTTKSQGDTFSERETSFIEVGVTPGISWKLSDKIALLASIGALSYRSGKNKDNILDVEQDFSNFGGRFNLSNFSFGIEFRF